MATLFLLRAIPFGVEFCTPEEKQKKKKIPKGDQPRSTGNAFDDSLLIYVPIVWPREEGSRVFLSPLLQSATSLISARIVAVDNGQSERRLYEWGRNGLLFTEEQYIERNGARFLFF